MSDPLIRGICAKTRGGSSPQAILVFRRAHGLWPWPLTHRPGRDLAPKPSHPIIISGSPAVVLRPIVVAPSFLMPARMILQARSARAVAICPFCSNIPALQIHHCAETPGFFPYLLHYAPTPETLSRCFRHGCLFSSALPNVMPRALGT